MTVEETIERLDRTRKILMSGDGEWSDAEEMDRVVTETLAHLRAMPKWISVESAPADTSILVYDKHNRTGFEAYLKGGEWHCMDGRNGAVTQLLDPPEGWQPLPKPPTEGQQ